MHIRKLVVLVLAAVLSITLLQQPASAAKKFKPGFNQKATSVAKAITCKNVRSKSGAGEFTKSSLVCDLKGRRVNVITFKDIRQQMEWTDTFPFAVEAGTKGYFGYNTGVVIVAKDLNKTSARVGAKALKGWVWSADSAWDQ